MSFAAHSSLLAQRSLFHPASFLIIMSHPRKKKKLSVFSFTRFRSFHSLLSCNSKKMDRPRTLRSGYSFPENPSSTTRKGPQARDSPVNKSATKSFAVKASHKDFPAKVSPDRDSTDKKSPANEPPPKNLASTIPPTACLPTSRFSVNRIVPGLPASQNIDLETLNKGMKQASLFSSSLNKEVSQSSSPNVSLRNTSSQFVECRQNQTSQRTIGASQDRGPGSKPENDSFDIFRTANVGPVKLNKPLHVLNKEKKSESERFKKSTEPQYLRSGMLLLKYFLNIADQVKVLNNCRELGIGSGGFYRPGYRNGSKLHLQMMCLGKDWDPDSRLYKDSRIFDNAVPPEIPGELRKMVGGALNAARNFLRQNSKNVEEIPRMSPDVCIVNFYNSSGKLGLHQDIDESKESIEKGLPVVSFSVGDSAEFLYGDVRDPDKAEKVMLESGDVLIFGGKSRLIFHGVPSIIPDTAPTHLTNETSVRPGRLNLTFRQV